MLTSGTVSINLLFMNEQFQLVDSATEQSIIASNSLQHMWTPCTFTISLRPTYCYLLSHAVYTKTCVQVLAVPLPTCLDVHIHIRHQLHGLTEQSNLLCTQVSWGQVYLWEQQVHITCIKGLRYTRTSWSVVTEWFTTHSVVRASNTGIHYYVSWNLNELSMPMPVFNWFHLCTDEFIECSCFDNCLKCKNIAWLRRNIMVSRDPLESRAALSRTDNVTHQSYSSY